jgi:hypothetical protein
VSRKAREGGGVGMDDELATPTSGFVECRLVPVMEGFQAEEDVSIAQTSLFNMQPGNIVLIWKPESGVITYM